ncbi:MAG TPA: DMT family transporter [Ktedonobacteraceae bacterium]|nr:DMT family transporter [Ktedonobacteraceae bacterium]
MSSTLATIVFGLAASLFWGSGDFNGGLASRRATASSVVVAAYAVGFVLLVVLALLWREPFPKSLDIFWGGLAGLAGAIGLVSFYSALSIGRMGIAAPISAVLTAGLPVIFSVFTEGLPNLLQLGGFVLALLAITLISRPEPARGRPEGIGLALLAGTGFGCFFILISRVTHGETFWPLAVARFTSVLFLLIMASIRRQPMRPQLAVTHLILLAGVLDAFGNVFFVLASHSGRLDVAAVLSSLYPAATVILAALLLRERVTRIQGIGILLALIAVPMISV